jgi:hypothetical protein
MLRLLVALLLCVTAVTWTRPSLATREVHVSLQSMGAYGGDSVQHGVVDQQAQPGPVTLWSAVDQRYFAVYFLPSTVTMDGHPVVVTIADPTGAGSGLAWGGGNLQYSVSSHTWTVGSNGSYLRVWQNHHDACMYQPYPALKHSKGEELTCTRCDSDMDMTSGLSKTSPPGANGRMIAAARYRLSGSDIVIVADDGPGSEPEVEAGAQVEAGADARAQGGDSAAAAPGSPDSSPEIDGASEGDASPATEGASYTLASGAGGCGCRVGPDRPAAPASMCVLTSLGITAIRRRVGRARLYAR